jgi:hypothetical protein
LIGHVKIRRNIHSFQAGKPFEEFLLRLTVFPRGDDFPADFEDRLFPISDDKDVKKLAVLGQGPPPITRGRFSRLLRGIRPNRGYQDPGGACIAGFCFTSKSRGSGDSRDATGRCGSEVFSSGQGETRSQAISGER